MKHHALSQVSEGWIAVGPRLLGKLWPELQSQQVRTFLGPSCAGGRVGFGRTGLHASWAEPCLLNTWGSRPGAGGPRKNGSGVESDGAQPVIRATQPMQGPEQQRLQELLEDVSSIEGEPEFWGGVCSPRWQNRKSWGRARDGHITSTHRVGSRLLQAGVWTPRAVTPTLLQVCHQHLCQVGAVLTAAIW